MGTSPLVSISSVPLVLSTYHTPPTEHLSIYLSNLPYNDASKKPSAAEAATAQNATTAAIIPRPPFAVFYIRLDKCMDFIDDNDDNDDSCKRQHEIVLVVVRVVLH